ncbi:copper amine oxidase N-terminal domain-containing protein [Paenibacillus thalictri]|uniref:Copper amine oxidase N-terminal domain-containing protein n=1 Tax=Paenibacillus thalictri TaxID=2527873 RepID=A0A4Q9DY69_9BACL|nr:copper amine oxidase N-terminal domain-containing protein [Paenibacillus thalictri]TBL80788.1 copper amine oxidase N-terminal domain-containing protein [Paenibacillus thalictri]
MSCRKLAVRPLLLVIVLYALFGGGERFAFAAQSADTGKDIAASEAAAPAQSGSGLFVSYMFASQRVERIKPYVAEMTRLTTEAGQLAQFGLATSDAAASMSERQRTSAERLKQAVESKEASYAQLSGYFSTMMKAGPGEGPEHASDPAAAAVDESAWMDELGRLWVQTVQPAAEAEALTKQAVQSAKLQQRFGLAGADGLAAAQATDLEAGLRLIEAKETFCRSLIDTYQQGNGKPIDIIHMTKAIQHLSAGSASLLQEWLAGWQDYAVKQGAGTPAPSAVLPSDTLPDGRKIESLSVTAVVYVPQPSISLPQPPVWAGGGEVYLPLRPYAESLGYTVEWDAAASVAGLRKGDGETGWLEPGGKFVMGGQALELASAPFAYQQVTYVPLSFFSQIMGVETYWNEELRQGIMMPYWK